MLIGNSWDISCGKFLCGYSGMITHGLHQNLVVEKKAHAGSPRLQEIPLTEKQKHIFRGGFAFLHSLPSKQGLRPALLKPYGKAWGCPHAEPGVRLPPEEKTARGARDDTFLRPRCRPQLPGEGGERED